MHRDRAEAVRRGLEGFEFFGFSLNALVSQDCVPGRSHLWSDYQAQRGRRNEDVAAAADRVGAYSSGIGTPDDMRRHLQSFADNGIDQVIFLQQAGHNRHDHICEALEFFTAEVMPEFKAEAAVREARKKEELAPYIAAAMKRKSWMRPLADHEIPVVKAAAQRAQFNRDASKAS